MNTEQHQRRDPGAGLAMSPQEFRLLLIGLVITLFLSALDNTIVGTAMPTIVGEFGGLARYTWVTTAYVITSTISTLVLGKLSDLYGRRRVYLIAIGGFLAASVLCGMAQDMNQLIVFRALQGIGGGGIMGLTFSIIGDVVPMRDRGRYFGLFTGVFAIAGVAGPLIGGVLVDNTSWRWIFYVNLPLGLVAITMVMRTLRLPHTRREVRLDVPGVLLLAAAICALMIPLEFGSTEGWTSPSILISLVAAAVLLVAFIWQERRAHRAPAAPSAVPARHHPHVDAAGPALRRRDDDGQPLHLHVVPVRAVHVTDPRRPGDDARDDRHHAQLDGDGPPDLPLGVYKRFPLVGLPLLGTGIILCTQIKSSTPVAYLAVAMLLMGLGWA